MVPGEMRQCSMVVARERWQDCQSTAAVFAQAFVEACYNRRTMDRLSSLLPRTLHKHGFAEEARASLVTFRAHSWIASRVPALAAHCSVRKCQGEELLLCCSHPAVAQELSLHVAELEEHLSSKEGPRIRVRITRSSSLAKGT